MTRIPTISYGSKSSPDEHGSIDQQLDAIRERIGQLTDGERFEFAGPFHEENASGYHGNRGPELEAALRAAESAAEEHGSAELWVWNSNRLGRGSGRKDEARSVMEVFTRTRRAGVILRSVTDDAYLQDEALIGMSSTMAHKHSADLSLTVKRAKDEAFEAGEWLGGPAPDGYAIQTTGEKKKATRKLIFNIERQPVVERMIELALEGRAPAAIAKELNLAGLRTAEGGPHTRRSVQNILSNQVYCGAIVRYRNRRVYRSGRAIEQPPEQVSWGPHHPAYLTRTDFETIQAAWASRDKAKKGRPAGGRPTRHYALSKLAVCGRCGAPMFASTSPYLRKDGTRRRRYQCKNVRASTGLCDAPPVDAEMIDRLVIEQLPRFEFDFQSWADQIGSEIAGERKEVESHRDRALAELDNATKMLSTHCDQFERWSAEGDELAARTAAGAVGKAEERVQEAQEALSAAQAAVEDAKVELPTDAMLDIVNELRRIVSGEVSAALPDGLRRVNERLTELFTAFRITTFTAADGAFELRQVDAEAQTFEQVPLDRDGVLVTPILSPDFADALFEYGASIDGKVNFKRLVPPPVHSMQSPIGPQE